MVIQAGFRDVFFTGRGGSDAGIVTATSSEKMSERQLKNHWSESH